MLEVLFKSVKQEQNINQCSTIFIPMNVTSKSVGYDFPQRQMLKEDIWDFGILGIREKQFVYCTEEALLGVPVLFYR
jgi:hypothetical protein